MRIEPLPSETSVRYVKGVGPKRALALERIGIRSLRDLLTFFPRRYEDRSQFRKISEMKPGEALSLRGEILSVKSKPIRRMQIIEMVVGDESGILHAVWFNQPYLKKQLLPGCQIILFGKIEWYKNRFQMTSPEFEVLTDEEESVHAGRITPVYPLTEGLFQKSMRTTLYYVIHNQLDHGIDEILPESFLSQKSLMPLKEAVRQMHFPEDYTKLESARKRIVFDEFLTFQTIFIQRMNKMKKKYKAEALKNGRELKDEFISGIPFALTEDQGKAVDDLIADMETEVPMTRLIQGDVGSGKTLMAAFAMFFAARNGKQSALLVPTEILAEQHAKTLGALLKPFQIEVALLTASTPVQKRERLVAEVKQGKIPVLVGTHAMLQEDVEFKSLALLAVDEQHKFGVHQRGRLLSRSPRPHQLVMTATPIPRTLALTVYGDLSVSTIKELPGGRKPIKTYWISRKKQNEVLNHVKKKVLAGEQAYFIFPLIEESEQSDLLAAEKEFRRLRSDIFKEISMGLVHGRMIKEERERVMDAFRKGEIKILVATSVIEVGIDHPNATVMIIENAERFGLAQLHQMRGRIGRGIKESECFLFGEPTTDEGKRRLRILADTRDGFVIAEEDLKLRGPGDFLGTRQSGEPYFKVANPLTDESLLREARDTAFHLVRSSALTEDREWAPFRAYLEKISVNY